MSCCPCPVERHAFQGCANCLCCVTWLGHPDRANDRSPEGRQALEMSVWVTLPGGVKDRMVRRKALELGLEECEP